MKAALAVRDLLADRRFVYISQVHEDVLPAQLPITTDQALEKVAFHASAFDAERAGRLSPCKRCRPERCSPLPT